MSRRDTIIISVLINAGLLSILFATAWNSDDEDSAIETEQRPVVQEQPQPQSLEVPEVAAKLPPPPQPIIASAQQEPEPTPVSTKSVDVVSENGEYLEISVKRGDFLGKIAQANGTSVEELVKLNNLRSTQLQIGQKIRIPIADTVKTSSTKGSAEVAQEDEKFHTVQRGDSPWSISNRYKISLGDILRLNDLDEESARNLRAGQKIRIR